jgi:hypothetical protein
MKKLLLPLLWNIVLLQNLCILQAQTTYDDATVQEYYWRFRERFRKHFVYIGNENGKSLPIIVIKPNAAIRLQTFDATTKLKTGSKGPWLSGSIEMGDGGVDLGNYLAFLATEHAVLRKEI